MAVEPANPLRQALKECRFGIVLLTVFSFFINLMILTSPIYMMQVYDRVLASGQIETLLLLTLIRATAPRSRAGAIVSRRSRMQYQFRRSLGADLSRGDLADASDIRDHRLGFRHRAVRAGRHQ
jgi:ABC-type protease/lipase transport system fused ATPase/permease subunit